MAALSARLMEAGADFTDGLSARGVHIAPQSSRELLVEAETDAAVEEYAALCRELDAKKT